MNSVTNHPKRRRSGVRLIVAFLALLAVLAGSAAPASAHAGNQTYLYIDISNTSVGGRLELPTSDLQTVLGLTLEGSDEAIEAEMAANSELITAYLGDHVILGGEDVTWPITFGTATLFYSDLPEADDNYVIVPFIADVGGQTVPRALEVTLDPFFDEIPGRDALALIGNDWAGGVIENGHEVTATFTSGSRTQIIDLGDSGWHKTVLSSVELGVNHIRTGPDHILFVFVLLLPSVLVFKTGWKPAPSFRSALWRVMKVVTMFTIAHTITFTLAGLEILPLPSPRITESIIAVSIAIAALHNLWPITHGREWLISFVFGLFHGLGFAGLVEGLDVSRSTQLLSLLGRNLGIEIGQTAVVLAFFPALFLLRRTRVYQPFFVGASLLLAAISVGWLIERLFELDLGVNNAIDPIFGVPAVFYVVGLFTAIAAGVFLYERQRDELIDVSHQDDAPDVDAELDAMMDAALVD